MPLFVRLPRWSALLVLGLSTAVSAGCLPSDSALHRDVRAKLDADPATAGVLIEVTHRVVYLSGKTATREQQLKAVDTARSIESVKLVMNNMTLDNAALAAKVKQALAADPVVGQVPIEAEAADDTVRLISTQTNAEQRERAVRIAGAVEGVGRVEDLMK